MREIQFSSLFKKGSDGADVDDTPTLNYKKDFMEYVLKKEIPDSKEDEEEKR